MMYTYLTTMNDAICPSKMKEMHLLPSGSSGAVTGSVCVTTPAPQRCAEQLLICGEEGRREDSGRWLPSDKVGN